MHYKSGRENVTLADDVRGRDDDKWRTRDTFALSIVTQLPVEMARSAGSGPQSSEDEVRHPKSANSGGFGWVLLRAQIFEEIDYLL